VAAGASSQEAGAGADASLGTAVDSEGDEQPAVTLNASNAVQMETRMRRT
jgi:hypothetical protein